VEQLFDAQTLLHRWFAGENLPQRRLHIVAALAQLHHRLRSHGKWIAVEVGNQPLDAPPLVAGGGMKAILEQRHGLLFGGER
jgi:hypothetical protein